MSTEHDRALARLEALVARPVEVAELPEDPSMADDAADEVAEVYAERGQEIDVDGLAAAYLAGGLEGVTDEFGEEIAGMMGGRIRAYRIPSKGGYATHLRLTDEAL